MWLHTLWPFIRLRRRWNVLFPSVCQLTFCVQIRCDQTAYGCFGPNIFPIQTGFIVGKAEASCSDRPLLYEHHNSDMFGRIIWFTDHAFAENIQLSRSCRIKWRVRFISTLCCYYWKRALRFAQHTDLSKCNQCYFYLSDIREQTCFLHKAVWTHMRQLHSK